MQLHYYKLHFKITVDIATIMNNIKKRVFIESYENETYTIRKYST